MRPADPAPGLCFNTQGESCELMTTGKLLQRTQRTQLFHGNTKPLKTQTLCCGAPCGSTVWGEAAEQMNRVRRRLSCRLQAGSIAGPTLTCVAQGTGLQDTFYGSFRANEGSQAPPGLRRGQSAPSAHPNLEPSSPCPLPGQRMGSKAPHSTARQRAKARPRSPKHGGCAQLSRVGDASRAPPDTHRDTTGEGGPSHRLPPGLKPLDDPLGPNDGRLFSCTRMDS